MRDVWLTSGAESSGNIHTHNYSREPRRFLSSEICWVKG